MKRRTLDRLVSIVGLALAALLLVAGGPLTWASSFFSQEVATQLSAQRITMPSGPAIENPVIKSHLEQYAGQPLTTGSQAKAYADHYIAVHMDAASGGKTYSKISGEYMAMAKDPNANADEVKQLGDLRQTLFMGNSLRGLLLNACAFGTMGTIAGIAAIAAFAGAGGLAILAFLGLSHANASESSHTVSIPPRSAPTNGRTCPRRCEVGAGERTRRRQKPTVPIQRSAEQPVPVPAGPHGAAHRVTDGP